MSCACGALDRRYGLRGPWAKWALDSLALGVFGGAEAVRPARKRKELGLEQVSGLRLGCRLGYPLGVHSPTSNWLLYSAPA